MRFQVTFNGEAVKADIFVEIACGEFHSPSGRLQFHTEMVEIPPMTVVVIEVRETTDLGNEVIWPEDGMEKQ